MRGPSSRAASLAASLDRSEEFAALWRDHHVGVMPDEVKRYRHPAVGLVEVNCQILQDPRQSHALLVYTAVPGTESYERLQLLGVVGTLVT